MAKRQLISSSTKGSEGYEQPDQLRGSVPYFDVVSSSYFQRYEEESPGGYAFRVRKQRLLELLDDQGGKVLDVGCGPGVMVEELTNLGFEYWGVDAAPSMIEECHKHFAQAPRAHFAVGDATRIDFPDGSFDTVVCMGVIDHIKDYELAVREMLRVLKPNGALLIAFPNLYSPGAVWRAYVFYPAIALFRPLYYRLVAKPRPPALKLFPKLHTPGGVCRLVQKNQGIVTSIVHYNFNQFISPLDEMFPRATLRLTARMERFRAGMLRWMGSGFIVKAIKAKS